MDWTDHERYDLTTCSTNGKFNENNKFFPQSVHNIFNVATTQEFLSIFFSVVDKVSKSWKKKNQKIIW